MAEGAETRHARPVETPAFWLGFSLACLLWFSIFFAIFPIMLLGRGLQWMHAVLGVVFFLAFLAFMRRRFLKGLDASRADKFWRLGGMRAGMRAATLAVSGRYLAKD